MRIKDILKANGQSSEIAKCYAIANRVHKRRVEQIKAFLADIAAKANSSNSQKLTEAQ